MEEGGRRRRVDDRSTVRLSSVGRTADVVERGPGFLQKRRDVFHRLVGLGAGITKADEFAIETRAGLSAQVNAVAGAHHLTKPAAEILAVRVRVVGVKFPQTLVRRAL